MIQSFCLVLTNIRFSQIEKCSSNYNHIVLQIGRNEKKWNFLEGNQNKNNCLVSNFYGKLKSPAFFPPLPHGEKTGKFQFVAEIAHKADILILIFL